MKNPKSLVIAAILVAFFSLSNAQTKTWYSSKTDGKKEKTRIDVTETDSSLDFKIRFPDFREERVSVTEYKWKLFKGTFFYLEETSKASYIQYRVFLGKTKMIIHYPNKKVVLKDVWEFCDCELEEEEEWELAK